MQIAKFYQQIKAYIYCRTTLEGVLIQNYSFSNDVKISLNLSDYFEDNDEFEQYMLEQYI